MHLHWYFSFLMSHAARLSRNSCENCPDWISTTKTQKNICIIARLPEKQKKKDARVEIDQILVFIVSPCRLNNPTQILFTFNNLPSPDGLGFKATYARCNRGDTRGRASAIESDDLIEPPHHLSAIVKKLPAILFSTKVSVLTNRMFCLFLSIRCADTQQRRHPS